MGSEQSSPSLPGELEQFRYEQEIGDLGDMILTQIDFSRPVPPGMAFVAFIDGQFVWLAAQWDEANRRMVGNWSASATEDQRRRVKKLLHENGIAEQLEQHYLTRVCCG